MLSRPRFFIVALLIAAFTSSAVNAQPTDETAQGPECVPAFEDSIVGAFAGNTVTTRLLDLPAAEDVIITLSIDPGYECLSPPDLNLEVDPEGGESRPAEQVGRCTHQVTVQSATGGPAEVIVTAYEPGVTTRFSITATDGCWPAPTTETAEPTVNRTPTSPGEPGRSG